VDSLGGEAGLAASRSQGSSLMLRLRPADPLAHPLHSEQRNGGGLLLRLNAGGASGVAVRADSSYRFAGLADAQYCSAPPPKRARTGVVAGDDFADAPDALEEAGEPQQLLTVPPFFFRGDVPHDYAFRTYLAPADAAAAGGAAAGAAGARATLPVTHEIDFRAAAVPEPLPAGSEFAAPPEIAALLGPLFEERGVWSTAALIRRLPRDSVAAARKYVSSHAYRFLNGPWHRLWVRRGLDPRTEPATRRFQCFDYRLPKEWYPRSAAGGGDGDDGDAGGAAGLPRGDFQEVHALRALPHRRTTFFQLSDLVHADIAALIGREPPERSSCDEHNGWFKKATLDAVKTILRESFDAIAAAQGLPVQPLKPRKNIKTGKAAKVAAALADARASVVRASAGGGGGAADEDADEEDEDEEAAGDEDDAAAPDAAAAALQMVGPGDAGAAAGDESGSDYYVFGEGD
jgi:general transcription factor 3C polypeptide 5 (transcription factor C subunit 1)